MQPQFLWVHRSFVHVDLESLVFFLSPSPSGKFTPEYTFFSFTSLFPQYRQHIQPFLSFRVALFEIYFCFMCVNVWAPPVCSTSDGHKRESDPLGTEVSLLSAAMWVLGIKPGSSGGAASILNSDHLSAPYPMFYIFFLCVWQNFDSSFQAWSLVMNFMLCVSLCTKLEVPFVVYFLNQREFICPFFSSPWGKILHSPDCPQTHSWLPCLFLASSGTTIMCLHAWLILTQM